MCIYTGGPPIQLYGPTGSITLKPWASLVSVSSGVWATLIRHKKIISFDFEIRTIHLGLIDLTLKNAYVTEFFEKVTQTPLSLTPKNG